jgi:hypothetical protein
MIAQVVKPAAPRARRLTDINECPLGSGAGALVADRGGELAAVIAQIPEPISPRRLANVSVNLVKIEQRLSSAGGVDDAPERLPDPFRTGCIVAGLCEIKVGKPEQVLDDPIRLSRRVGQDLVEDHLRIRNGLPDEPFEVTEVHAPSLVGSPERRIYQAELAEENARSPR